MESRAQASLVRGRLGNSLGGFDFSDGGLGGSHRVLGDDAEVNHVLNAVALQVELLNGDGLAMGAKVPVPRHDNVDLDGDTSLDSGRKHDLFVLGVSSLESFHGRHRYDASFDALAGRGLGGNHSLLDLGTGSHEGDIRSVPGVD